MKKYNCIVVLGPTASGKTHLACQLAYYLNGEIISADSRQVYRHLNIGTGKDLDEYKVEGKQISYHLIDIVEPVEQFYLHQFMHALRIAFNDIAARNKLPIICGGTGLYLDALRKDFSFTEVKENEALRQELELLPKEVLIAKLNQFPREFIGHVDTHSKKRIIRGIEVAEELSRNKGAVGSKQFAVSSLQGAAVYQPYYIGVRVSLEERKEKISKRLKERVALGLIEEVEGLLKKGIDHERLQRFGLEYKFISLYLQKKISNEELFAQLQTAIFQFAKKQMTWFRKMEKEGVEIHWVEPGLNTKNLAAELERKFKERNIGL